MKQKSIWIGILAILFSFSSQADNLMIGPQLYRSTQKVSGPSTGESEQTDLWVDWKIGYLLSFVYVGAVYTSFERSSTAGNNATVFERRNGTGGTLGFTDGSIFLDLSYFFQSEWKTSSILYSPGNAIGIDLGARWSLAENFYVTALLNYKAFTYSKITIDAVTMDQVNKVTVLAPFVGLGLQF